MLRSSRRNYRSEFVKFFVSLLDKVFFCYILLSLKITVLPISGGANRDVIAKGAWGCVYGFGWSKDAGSVRLDRDCHRLAYPTSGTFNAGLNFSLICGFALWFT